VKHQDPLPQLSPRWKLSRHTREWCVLLLALALLASAIGWELYRKHGNNRMREQTQLQNQARVVEENLVRQMQGVNSAITGVRYDMFYGDHETNTLDMTRRLQMMADAMPGVRALTVLDQNGIVVGGNRKFLLGNNFSTRPYFTVPKLQPDYTTLYVSQPFLSVLNLYVLGVSKAVSNDAGQFAGVVAAILDPDYFDIVMRSVVYAPDMAVSIAHGDGKVFLVTPPGQNVQDQDDNLSGSFFRAHVDSGSASSNFVGPSTRSDSSRMVAMRNIMPTELRMNKPLTIAVSRDLAAVDAIWWTEAQTAAGVFGLICVGASMAMAYVHNRRRALKQAHATSQKALQETARRFEFGLKGADLGLWDWHLPDDTLTINEREWQMMGLAPRTEPLKALFWQSLIHPHDLPAVRVAFAAHIEGHTPVYKVEHRMQHGDGHWVWVLSHAIVIERDPASKAVRILGTHLDISERKQAETKLADATALQRRTGEIAKIGGIQVELPSLQQTWTPEVFHIHDMPVGTPPPFDEVLNDFAPHSRTALQAATRAAIEHGTSWTLELEMTTELGRYVWVRSKGEAVLQDGVPVRIMGTLQDITERMQFLTELQRANTQLAQLTITDGLTGVGNRRFFDQSLLSEWARGARQKQHLALLMIDIDHFKLYNDSYGHQGGDTCLREVARLLTTCICRPGELLMRYGGEEFAILLLDTDSLGASVVAQRCLDSVLHAALPHNASLVSHCVSLSIGVASLIPSHEARPEDLIAQADAALYQAKHQGRARYVRAPHAPTETL
jgi:diguanylate cyclase (GGDEF)-like protein/PAS domain S-box-containing protein